MPMEPMSVVMNSALGSWNMGPEAVRGHLPGHMHVDYVRVYQRRDKRNSGCDPPDYPTKEYIDANPELYGEPALPPGDETCPGVYPPPTRPWPGSGPGAGPSTPVGQLVVGGLVVAVALLGLLVLLGAGAAFLLRRRRGAAAQSQYRSVDGAIAAPMLEREAREAATSGS